jgi:putative chitinase
MIDAQLPRIADRPPNDNMRSICLGLEVRAADAGLDRPHRLAHYIAQLGHESAGFHYDREVWGPTAAQRGYDTRTDLGNTPAADGDGKRFMGRTGGQITGRGNYEKFTAWARAIDPQAPDFVLDPEAINTDPWEGLGPIWYWEAGNPTGKPLSRYADENDIEMITRRWNGGLNGYNDRLAWYARAGLVLLGLEPEDVRRFQSGAGLTVDGLAGPRTRAAIHEDLLVLPAMLTPSAPVRDTVADVVRELDDHLAAVRALVARLEALAGDRE